MYYSHLTMPFVIFGSAGDAKFKKPWRSCKEGQPKKSMWVGSKHYQGLNEKGALRDVDGNQNSSSQLAEISCKKFAYIKAKAAAVRMQLEDQSRQCYSVRLSATILEHQSYRRTLKSGTILEIYGHIDLTWFATQRVILLVRWFNRVVDMKWPSASIRKGAVLTLPGVWKPSWLQPTSGHLHDSSQKTGHGDDWRLLEKNNLSTQSVWPYSTTVLIVLYPTAITILT